MFAFKSTHRNSKSVFFLGFQVTLSSPEVSAVLWKLFRFFSKNLQTEMLFQQKQK